MFVNGGTHPLHRRASHGPLPSSDGTFEPEINSVERGAAVAPAYGLDELLPGTGGGLRTLHLRPYYYGDEDDTDGLYRR